MDRESDDLLLDLSGPDNLAVILAIVAAEDLLVKGLDEALSGGGEGDIGWADTVLGDLD